VKNQGNLDPPDLAGKKGRKKKVRNERSYVEL
jgi:hypothetical protein